MEMQQASKKWNRSKTIWFNVCMLVVGSLPIIGTLAKVLVADQAIVIDAVLVAATGITNLVLRIFFTDQPISR